ncbi:MAG: energy-coupling factor ABC transporter ATP-binding protein [Spirochaetaceae bacterium]|jgi:cobalt/nickel transport system ATP-binding protein|nr:energy-coupling factor ABC transporter ATP-binding protein [Spirochaetaceae bacterium]
MEKLVLQNISCVYDGAIKSLNDISFSVLEGECICVAGANGSGKSTLLQVISGCVKPSSGSVIIDGVTRKNGEKEKISALVFQEPEDQLFMPSVWEDVAFGVMNKDMDCETAKTLAIAALESVDAAALAERAPYKLSGGEKQRAALASVLIMEPEILLLDEPTASLDPRARKKLINLLKKIPRTKIIATHDLDMALDIANRVIFLNGGRIAADSEVPGLLLDETFLQNAGLELPLSRRPPR